MTDRTQKPDNGKSGTNRVQDWQAYWDKLEQLFGKDEADNERG